MCVKFFKVILKIKICSRDSGITWADGYRWLEQRRFVISTLKDFGMGKNVLQEKVQSFKKYENMGAVRATHVKNFISLLKRYIFPTFKGEGNY